MGPILALLLLAAQEPAAPPRAELAPLFGDHMVLQCGREIALWGQAAPGAIVVVELQRKGEPGWVERRQSADGMGRWIAQLPAQEPGGPCSLRIAADAHESIALEDVWFGEVWLCSGQSNMEWPLAQSARAEEECAAADQPLVRLFTVPHAASASPLGVARGRWSPCTAQSAASFSAVGYHFGRELAHSLGRPVGLIQSTWGGTPAEAWTERSFLEGVEDFAPILERAPPSEAWAPSALFNGMIAPLAGLQLAGAIWYQGESNADRAQQYRSLFPAMIHSWRWALEQEDLPFLFVQLASFKPRLELPGESAWAELREAQAQALALQRTGMAVAIDVGDPDDIHPRDKRTVGERLAREALRSVYGRALESRGPTCRSLALEGGMAVVAFDHAAGLCTSDGGPPLGFALAGTDRVFRWADAVLLEGGRVELRSPAVPAPVAVRFAWADNPAHNLLNGAGLPAVPFRTDDWPGLTAGVR